MIQSLNSYKFHSQHERVVSFGGKREQRKGGNVRSTKEEKIFEALRHSCWSDTGSGLLRDIGLEEER